MYAFFPVDNLCPQQQSRDNSFTLFLFYINFILLSIKWMGWFLRFVVVNAIYSPATTRELLDLYLTLALQFRIPACGAVYQRAYPDQEPGRPRLACQQGVPRGPQGYIFTTSINTLCQCYFFFTKKQHIYVYIFYLTIYVQFKGRKFVNYLNHIHTEK